MMILFGHSIWQRGLQLLLIAGATGSLQAQTAARTFVSTAGIDTNPCTAGQPCRTFTRAITQTASGGEVLALDSGGYGAFTLSRPMRITAAPGVYACINVPSSNSGVRITNTGGQVSLQGLTILGGGGALSGIHVTGTNHISVSNCQISALPLHGIFFVPSGFSEYKLEVSDTVIKNCNGNGVHIQSASGGFTYALLERVTVAGANQGLYILGSAGVTVGSCIFHKNQTGVNVDPNGTSRTILRDCTLTLNNLGIEGGGQGGAADTIIQVANSTIANNGAGLQSAGGTDIVSLGGNEVNGNMGGGETFPATIAKK